MKTKYTKYIVFALLGLFITSTVVSCAAKAKCGSTRRTSKKKWRSMGT